jgi:pyruvate-formate lyase-activating enzyme
MYVPAYPLPLLEIGSFVKSRLPKIDLSIISMAVDYGLPLTPEGKSQIYGQLLNDLSEMKPKGIGISCTAISQAEEVIELCELIKEHHPATCIFLGGYFPTLYYKEIFARTSAVDLIVLGEGEESALDIITLLEEGKKPSRADIPNLAYREDGHVRLNRQRKRFDLRKKALLNLELLRYPREYDVLPYSFSRGCPHHCNFCMEEFIRPYRKEVPRDIVEEDLKNLSLHANAQTLVVSDALFLSFDLFPFLRKLDMKVNFETRCDAMDSTTVSKIADVCGMLVMGFESASYDSLRRMNKIRDETHYQRYLANAKLIFSEAVQSGIPIMVFMIAGYPGDTEKDLERSLRFAEGLAEHRGRGGYVFKIGECHVYPNTKIHDLALSLPDVVFDDDGVFGLNIVRRPSKDLEFKTVLQYMNKIFHLSHLTPKLEETMTKMMPFFRLPVRALADTFISDSSFRSPSRDVFEVRAENLAHFRKLVPKLRKKYEKLASGERNTRTLHL